MRSSNCPRYLVPATSEAKSRVMTRLLYKIRETFFWTMRKANPSAMALLPTPGSPMSRGLFFLRRLSICDTRSISFSRPTTGSSLSCSANSVRSRPKLSSTGVFDFCPFLAVDFEEAYAASSASSLSSEESLKVSAPGLSIKSSSEVIIDLNCSFTPS